MYPVSAGSKWRIAYCSYDDVKTYLDGVTATVNPTSVTISKSTVTLTGTGSTYTLTANVAPSNATNKSVTWNTSNSKVATVSSSGVVTAVATGTANITVKTSDGKTAVCKVTVTIPQTTQTAQLVSTSEISSAAAKYGISKSSNAYKALESINTKYYSKLASSKNGTLIFFFEGVGSNSSANKRMNAMCVVVKGGKIVFIDRNSSTIPDHPFNPAKNGGDPMPTIKSEIYNFKSTNHHNKYATLNIINASVVRFKSKSSFYNSTSPSINIHKRSQDSIITSGTPNSAGCLLVGVKPNDSSKTSAYTKFIYSVGIVGSNGTSASKYQYNVTGKVIIDRSYAPSYLKSIGYPAAAISLIG